MRGFAGDSNWPNVIYYIHGRYKKLLVVVVAIWWITSGWIQWRTWSSVRVRFVKFRRWLHRFAVITSLLYCNKRSTHSLNRLERILSHTYVLGFSWLNSNSGRCCSRWFYCVGVLNSPNQTMRLRKKKKSKELSKSKSASMPALDGASLGLFPIFNL